jgi:hypothetical protein
MNTDVTTLKNYDNWTIENFLPFYYIWVFFLMGYILPFYYYDIGEVDWIKRYVRIFQSEEFDMILPPYIFFFSDWFFINSDYFNRWHYFSHYFFNDAGGYDFTINELRLQTIPKKDYKYTYEHLLDYYLNPGMYAHSWGHFFYWDSNFFLKLPGLKPEKGYTLYCFESLYYEIYFFKPGFKLSWDFLFFVYFKHFYFEVLFYHFLIILFYLFFK